MVHDFKIKGVDYPDAEKKTTRHKPFFSVPLIRPRYFLWLLGVSFIAIWIAFHGTVHLRFSYVGKDLGSAFGDDRFYYTRCDYVGLHSQRVFPRNGKCPLFAWLKPEGDH